MSWDAKRGVYMVLKLDESAMNWHSAHKTRVPICGDDDPSVKIESMSIDPSTITDHYTAGAASAK